MVVFLLFLNIFLFVYIWRFIIRNPNVSPSPSTTSTLTTAQPQVIKYHDVFLSFRGEDTRVGFTSHLHAALYRKQILTFIDYQLVRGDEISASLLRTIEEAKLSVIVFSENYASSKWCLEELAKIIERRRNNRQIVIPVFYKVDPSHVRNQTGSFGHALARLIKKKALTMDTEQSFRKALTDAANLSGRSLGNSEPESKFIEKIVGDVLEKLHAMSSSHSTPAGLIGIDVRVSKVESLLNINSPDVLIIGIWGMGGIGKTTIADVVCNKVRSRFEGIFFANFRQQSDLQRSFLSQLLGQETLNTMGSLSFRDPFVRDRLSRKKLFIVLDDVHNSMALEEWRDLLDDRNSSFGPGSKVLITGRDKQVLKNVVDETYKVERLNYEEAIQLFNLKALKNCITTIDQRHLIEQIERHVQGNPLALKVLGSSLYGKSIEEWRSALKKLAQDPQIERALRISYDGLDSEQKSIFLDIAHFFLYWNQNNATRILDGFYGRSVIFDISTLIDKCLITTTYDNRLEMHDLLQEMAFNIVRAESDFPGERSRLCHLPDVVQVLEENKGTRKIKGISLGIDALSRQIHLKSDAFAMMDGLRFLNFYGHRNSKEDKMLYVIPPTGLEYLPNELRYLKWIGFPSKSLPPSFRAEHLVELHLRGSKLVKLWTGVKDVGNLRRIDLSYSEYLTELPDLSMAKNLQSLKLEHCESLTEVPSSLQYLDKLEELDLFACYNLRSLPMLDSKVLRKLFTSSCLDLTTCPTISQNMKSLRLWETSIKEVPQSIAGKLKVLSLSGCSKMTKFPEISSIQFLTRLQVLSLSGCSKLESFPEITVLMKSLQHLCLSETGIKEIPSISFKHMTSLKILELGGTPLKELPSSIQFLTGLESLGMSGCSKLESFPEITVPMESLQHLYLSGTGIKEMHSISFKHMTSLTFLTLDGTPLKELPSSIQFLTRLEKLEMSGCSKLESFPEITVLMKSLQHLCLSETGIKEIPSISFKHMTSLKILELDGTPLKELPSSIQFLTGLESLGMSGCSKLESFPEITVPMESLQHLYLSGTGIKEMHSISFKHMTSLTFLTLDGTPLKELPSSIQFLTRLEKLEMSGCSKLESFPEITVPMESLQHLYLSGTGIKEMHSISFKHMTSLTFLTLDGTPLKELPSSIQFLTGLKSLGMSGCSKLESFPEITVPMESLKCLDLSRTCIKEIHSISFKHITSLERLYLNGTPIKALPKLPHSLEYLSTDDCASLETAISIINIGRLWHNQLDFRNCFKLDQKPLVAAMHLKIQSEEEIPDGGIQMVLPGSEIPEWFGDKGIGSSLAIQLPSNCHQLKGIAFCLVFLVPLPFHKVYYNYHVKGKNGKHDEVVFASREEQALTNVLVSCDSYHMILHYELELVNHLRKYSGNEVTFKFYHVEVDDKGREVDHDIRRPFKLKSCGVYLHFDENILADESSEEN